jgi:hypothetical protein
MTHIALLQKQGHCLNVTFADDDAKQLAAAAVAENPGWKPGDAIRVPPRPMRAYHRTALAVKPLTRESAPRVRAREHAPRAGTGRRTSSASRDGPRLPDDDPEPPLKPCRGCGKAFRPDRPNHHYHSKACKQRAWRQHHALDLAALLERHEQALRLVRRGELHPLDALELVVWPGSRLLGASRRAVAA